METDDLKIDNRHLEFHEKYEARFLDDIEDFNIKVNDKTAFDRFYIDPEYVKERWTTRNISPNDVIQLNAQLKKAKKPEEKTKIITDYIKIRYIDSYLTHDEDIEILSVNQKGHFRITAKQNSVIDIHTSNYGTKIPIVIERFQGNGVLDVAGCNLTTLMNLPDKVEGSFLCNDNNLETLEHGPSIVTGDYDCSKNPLKSFLGAPKEIGGVFACDIPSDFNAWDELPVAKNYKILSGNVELTAEQIKELIAKTRTDKEYRQKIEKEERPEMKRALTSFADYFKDN